MAPVLVLAAPTLDAPDDPGSRGLWGLIALVLLIGLVAAHLRVLRAISRAGSARPAESTGEAASAPQEAADGVGPVPFGRPQASPRDQAPDLARW